MACSISELLNNKAGGVQIIFIVVEKLTSFACLVGSVLNDIFQLKAQSRIFTKSLFGLKAETLALFTTYKKEVSSANNLTFVVNPRRRSLMKMRKNNGPRTEPCGTTAVTDSRLKIDHWEQPIDIYCLKTIH